MYGGLGSSMSGVERDLSRRHLSHGKAVQALQTLRGAPRNNRIVVGDFRQGGHVVRRPMHVVVKRPWELWGDVRMSRFVLRIFLRWLRACFPFPLIPPTERRSGFCDASRANKGRRHGCFQFAGFPSDTVCDALWLINGRCVPCTSTALDSDDIFFALSSSSALDQWEVAVRGA